MLFIFVKNQNILKYQYLIMAYDPGTPEGLAHRMEVRPRHLEYMRKYKAEGNFVIGGAHLDDAQNMQGSMLIIQFETAGEIKIYEANEPYIQEKVWTRYEIIPFRIANV
jgi:uncharacterized protein